MANDVVCIPRETGVVIGGFDGRADYPLVCIPRETGVVTGVSNVGSLGGWVCIPRETGVVIGAPTRLKLSSRCAYPGKPG